MRNEVRGHNADLIPRIVHPEVPLRKWEGRERDNFGWTKIQSEVKFEMPVSHPSGNVK